MLYVHYHADGTLARRGADAAVGGFISASKRADQLQAAARLQGRMDAFVNRTDGVLKRRLADFVERGDGAGDVGEATARRGDDLGDAVRLQLGEDGFQTSKRLDSQFNNQVGYEPRDTKYRPGETETPDTLSRDLYESIEKTPTGQNILRQIDDIGARPRISYDDELLDTSYGVVGARYHPIENTIKLSPELQDLPEEVVTAMVTHELTHRIGRQLAPSTAHEVVAHVVELKVLEETGGLNAARRQLLDTPNLSGAQKQLLESIEEISQMRTINDVTAYVNRNYRAKALPDYSLTWVKESRAELEIWEAQRDLMAQQGFPNAFAGHIKEVQERLEFWKSLKE